MNKSIKLLQITDCHLQETPLTAFKGYDPDQRLDAVINHVESQQLPLANFDHLLLTGDLAHCAKVSVYQRVLDKTQHLANQTHWLAGNHDDMQVMQTFVDMRRNIVIDGNWAIVLLDSTAAANGLGSGSLSDAELCCLSKVEQLTVSHILLALHHPPVEFGSLWQDAIKLGNSSEFWRVLKSLTKIRAITFGHLHQEQHLKKGQIELFCTPATAPQFKERQITPVLEDNPHLAAPGYRLLELHPDGKISTTVHRVPAS